MTLAEFRQCTTAAKPPATLSRGLLALWHDARGDWESAHQTAQDLADETGAWIHAYLHRKEGDAGNAAYWYRRAGRPVCRATLADEWQEIACALTDFGPFTRSAGQ